MSNHPDAEVTFGKPKKRTGRPRVRDGGGFDAFGAEQISAADQGEESLQLDLKPTSSGSKTKLKPALSFEAPEEEDGQTFTLKKGGAKKKKKKASLFDDSTPTMERPQAPESSDMYSSEAMEKLKAENKTQFVVVPLSKSDQALLAEDELLLQHLDATALVRAPQVASSSAMDISEPTSTTEPEEIIDGTTMEEENDQDDSMFRSKQVEAARALRARLKHGDHAVDGEHAMDDLEKAMDKRRTRFNKEGKISRRNRMDLDEDGSEDSEDSNANSKDDKRGKNGRDGDGEEVEDDVSSDGEADERAALGLAWNGRHQFEDATKKVKLHGMETLREHVGAEAKADDFFGAQNSDDFEWELSLIKRSGVKRGHNSITASSLAATSSTYSTNNLSSLSKNKGTQTRIEIPTIPERTREPWSEDEIMKQLAADIAQLSSVSATHQARLTSLEHAKKDHEVSLASADSAFTQASTDLGYFEELKLYILDLVDCVESKMGPIGDVEEQMLQARIARTRKTQSHTKAAFQEQFEHCRRAITLSSTTLPQTPPKWTDLQARLASKKMEVADGADSFFTFESPNLESLDGYGSDDETTPEDHSRYLESLESIRSAAVAVFEDAMDDFCKLDTILGRIADFRAKYSFSYRQSHTESDLPTLLGPFVRLELVPWDPLKSPNFNEWPWFEAVDHFASTAPEDESTSKQPTPLLTTAIATEILLPIVKNAINYFWRANSVMETKALQALLANLRHVLPPAALGQILQLIHTNFLHAIMAFELPSNNTITSKSPNPLGLLALEQYTQIAFARALKLLHVCTLWKPFFSPDALGSLIWENLVNSKIVPYLQSSQLKLADCWRSLRLVVAALGPLVSDPAFETRGSALSSLIKAKEEEAFGHFEASEIAENVLAHINALRSR